ncbi:MAG TPA: IclR family transcriptional regulator [Advenella sp.]|nr:IclR family transcriptional regulator [Advenella sp.]
MKNTEKHSDPRFATTVAHGMSLLHCFRMTEPALSNKDLAERTGLSKATISRLTYTLALKGLLLYDGQLRRYRLGAGILSLAHPMLSGIRLRQMARPFMRALADLCEGSVSLGLYDNLHMVYIETSRGHEAIGFRPDIGARLPLLGSAMGRAWLANAPEALRNSILEQIRSEDDWQLQTHGAAWKRAQHDWDVKGYCLSFGDWQADIHAVAVAMREPVGGDYLVFNCGVPVSRLKSKTIEEVAAGPLLAMVDEINRRRLSETNNE